MIFESLEKDMRWRSQPFNHPTLAVFNYYIIHNRTFHYGVSSLQLPESFISLFSYGNYSYCSLLSTGITKFEFEKENEINSGCCSQMSPP